jgi:AcrR family transcriptional regulator
MTPTDTAKAKKQLSPEEVKALPPLARAMRADAVRNREAILEAARKLFAAQGMDTQMDEIAAAAKVGVGTVYRHFPNKEDLLDALVAKRFEILAGRAREAVAEAKEGDPWTAFRSFIEFSAEFQATDRAHAQSLSSRSERMACAAQESGLPDAAAELIGIAQRAGALRKDLAVEDIPALTCSMGSVALAAAEKPRMRWERLLAIWLDGVRAPAGGRLPPIPE